MWSIQVSSGKILRTLLLIKKSTWIIDTNLSNHMTKDSGKLICHKLSSRSAICIANNSISPVTGERSIIWTDTITLYIVLIASSLAYNFLSVIYYCYSQVQGNILNMVVILYLAKDGNCVI